MLKWSTLKRLGLPLSLFLILNNFSNAQNYGFEAPVSTPPSGWTAVSGTWPTVNNTTFPSSVRTGTQAMSITDPATTGNTMGNTVPTVTTTASGQWLITMCWARANNNTNARINIGFRSGTLNTLNPSATTAGQTPNLDLTYQRIISVSANTVAAGSYSPAVRAHRSATNPTNTQIFMDDFIIYASSSNIPDTIAPNPAGAFTAVQAAGFDLSWVNTNDNGNPASGLGGVVILRTNIVGVPAPTLNDQAIYSPLGGAAGVNQVVDSAANWTVIAAITDTTISTFSDTSANPALSYTYAIYTRDRAFNYSSGTTTNSSGPVNMAYFSSTTSQITGNVFPGDLNQAILRVSINMTGTLVPLSLNLIDFNTNGSTNPSIDISSAKVYFTGNSAVFSTTTPFGSPVSSPSGQFTVVGNQILSAGLNNFWLAYDVSSAAGGNNLLDAECISVNVGGTSYTPTITAPAGNRQIKVPLNGTYTIGGTSPSYATIDLAVADLNLIGIGGPVIFNIRPGTYLGQHIINQIQGSSTVNTVTFKAENGDSTSVIITHPAATTAPNNYTIWLNGADNMVFTQLTLERSGTNQANSRIVELSGGANNIRFESCVFNGPNSNVSADASGLRSSIFSPNNSTENSLVVRNNRFIGNGNALWFNGAAGGPFATGTIIEDNFMETFYVGAFLLNQSNPTIRRNTMIRINQTSTIAYFGVSIRFIRDGFTISDNKITCYNGFNGITIRDARGTSANRALVANNMVQVGGTATSATRGISLEDSSQFVDIVYNSAWMNVVNLSNARVFNIIGTNAVSINIWNNSFVNTGQGFAYFIGDASVSGVDSSNNNNIFSNGTNIAYWTTNHPTLASLRLASNKESASVSGDPDYVSILNLTPQNTLLNDVGVPFTGVSTDIFGNIRNPLTPDIGAVEYTPSADDIALLAVLVDEDRFCTNTTYTVRFVVRNIGNNLITSFLAQGALVGAAPINITNNIVANISAGNTDTLVAGTFTPTIAGAYAGPLWVTLPGDLNNTNDTINVSISVTEKLSNPTILTPSQTVCTGSSAFLAASGTDQIQWFSNSALTNLLGMGDSVLFGPITNNTTIYASNDNGISTNVGIQQLIPPGSSGSGTTNFGIVFDVFAPFTLKSVLVYPVSTTPGTPGIITIDVIDGNSNILHTAVVNALGYPSTAPVGQRVTLDFDIVPGTNYKIRPRTISSGFTQLLFQPAASAPNGNWGYPFTVPGIVTLVTSTLTAAPLNTARNDFYYYFYDWEITTSSGCPGFDSATILISNIPPIPAFSFTTNQLSASFSNWTNGGATYNWNFGDGIGTSSAENPNYTYAASGAYNVTLNATNACGGPVSVINLVNVILVGLSDELTTSTFELQPFPVPAQSFLKVQLPELHQSGLLKLSDSKGVTVFSKVIQSSENQLLLSVSEYSRGLYILSYELPGKRLTKQIILE